MAISPDQFRLDGRPRATARADHPGVVLSLDVPQVGHLAYPCNTYDLWHDNLRAIALALEALRRVDRYGVTSHGEQYRGFLALDATATSQPCAAAAAAAAARTFLSRCAGHHGAGWLTDAELVRRAKRAAHPDTGGNAEFFQRVLDAERALLEAGRL